MQLLHNVNLKDYNTFHINENASLFTTIHTVDELIELLYYNEAYQYSIQFIGGGSNILLTKPIEGITVLNKLKGITLISENEHEVIVEFMSGESWHESVMWCVNNGYGGVENLSLIPGTIGAAPIQNIGAYGVELKDVFASCETINLASKERKTFSLDECQFGYRESIFKTKEKGNYFILSVNLCLQKKPTFKIEYGDIKHILASKFNNQVSIESISKAVIEIRSSKLPDPKVIGNAGSFFKNPVITKQLFDTLLSQYPQLPNYPAENGIKIPAGWLIEQCGWKGYKVGKIGVHEKQALVLVNFSNAEGSAIYQLSEQIIISVQQRFNITLEREVNIW
jgi:UDP-N-acetylmuramate dehydrogenase